MWARPPSPAIGPPGPVYSSVGCSESTGWSGAIAGCSGAAAADSAGQLGQRPTSSRGDCRATTGRGQGQLVRRRVRIDQIPGGHEGDQRDQRGERAPLAIVAPAVVAAHEARHRVD